jgi:hypothetical protein
MLDYVLQSLSITARLTGIRRPLTYRSRMCGVWKRESTSLRQALREFCGDQLCSVVLRCAGETGEVS